jgi:hypothetical protein
VAHAVVVRSLAGVREHLVGGPNRLELVARTGVGIDVRVVLAGLLAVGPPDILGGRVGADVEQFVEVRWHERAVGHHFRANPVEYIGVSDGQHSRGWFRSFPGSVFESISRILGSFVVGCLGACNDNAASNTDALTSVEHRALVRVAHEDAGSLPPVAPRALPR